MADPDQRMRKVLAMTARACMLVPCLVWPLAGFAACDLVLAPATIALGDRHTAALPADVSGGWRLLGQATTQVSGSCDRAPARLRLAVEGLRPDGAGLLSWDTAAASSGRVHLVVLAASVGGQPVAIGLAGRPEAPAAGPLPVSQDSVIELDLQTLPPQFDRRHFSVTLQVSGLVRQGFAASTATRFMFSPRFSWLPP